MGRKDSGAYRPTVRYDDRYRDYVEELFHCTDLDRNQLLRAALLFFGSEGEGKTFLTSHLLTGRELPSPLGARYPSYGLWQGSRAELIEGERDVNMGDLTVSETIEGGTSSGEQVPVIVDERGNGRRIYKGRRAGAAEGFPREVSGGIQASGGGITFRLE